MLTALYDQHRPELPQRCHQFPRGSAHCMVFAAIRTFCSYNNTSSRLVQPHQQTEALMSSVRSLQLLQNRQFQSIFLKPWTNLAVLPFLPNP